MKNKDNIEKYEVLKKRKNTMKLKHDIDVALTKNYDFTQKRAEMNRIFDLNMKTILAVCTLGVTTTFNAVLPEAMTLNGISSILAHIGITAVTVGAGAIVYKEFRDDAINQVFGNKINYKIAKEAYNIRKDEADEKIDLLINSVSNSNDKTLYEKCEEYLTEDNSYYKPYVEEQTETREKAKVRSLTKYKETRRK